MCRLCKTRNTILFYYWSLYCYHLYFNVWGFINTYLFIIKVTFLSLVYYMHFVTPTLCKRFIKKQTSQNNQKRMHSWCNHEQASHLYQCFLMSEVYNWFEHCIQFIVEEYQDKWSWTKHASMEWKHFNEYIIMSQN